MSDFFDSPEFQEGLNEDNDLFGSVIDNNKDDSIYVVFSFYPQKTYNHFIERVKWVIKGSFGLDSSPLTIYKNDIVFVGFGVEIINEDHKFWLNCLKNLCNVFMTSHVSVTTKIDNVLSTKSIYADTLINEERKTCRKLMADYLEQLKAKTLDSIDIEGDIFSFRKLYHCEGLVMKDIDSEIDIDDECLKYLSTTTNTWLSNTANINLPFPDDALFSILHYPNMIPDFPILIKKNVPSYEELWEIKMDRRYMPKGNVLGYYTRKDESFCRGPHIVLSPENIKSASEKFCIPFRVLMAKVLVHELAHSIMDKYRIKNDKEVIYTDIKDNWPNCLEAKAMEESLANALTLSCFKTYASSQDLECIQHFIDDIQSAIYRFGLWQEVVGVDWVKWRDTNKHQTSSLTEWFNNCFCDGMIRIPKMEYSIKNFLAALE